MKLKYILLDKRPIQDPVLWTNGLFFVNAALWLYAGLPWCALAIMWAGATSLMYHRSIELSSIYHKLDQSAAVMALVCTVGFSIMSMLLVEWLIVLLFLGVGLKLKAVAHEADEDYEGWHTAWHICVFGGQAILALSHT